MSWAEDKIQIAKAIEILNSDFSSFIIIELQIKLLKIIIENIKHGSSIDSPCSRAAGNKRA